MSIFHNSRQLVFIFISAVTLILSGCAVSDQKQVAQPLFENQTDFHVTELTPTPAVMRSDPADKQSAGDLWLVMREGFRLPEISGAAVKTQARRFAAGRSLQLSLDRSSVYLFYILQELKSRGMPTEIALLPFIESSYSPLQKGTMHHAGIWGIMPAAGKHLKLIQNAYKDERRDILRSTQGALDYLQELYAMYDDWQLAIVAYNWGPGNVTRAVSKARSQKIAPTYENLSLPKAARDYLVWIAAYKEIVNHPSDYNVTLPALENYPYFVVIDVTRDIDISVVLELAEISKAEFQNLNPSFNRSVILSAPEQKILLPYANAEHFQKNLKDFSKPLSSGKQTGSTQPVSKNKK